MYSFTNFGFGLLFFGILGSAKVSSDFVDNELKNIKQVLSNQQKVIEFLISENADLKSHVADLEITLGRQVIQPTGKAADVKNGEPVNKSEVENARMLDNKNSLFLHLGVAPKSSVAKRLAQQQIAFHLVLTANTCFNDHEIIKFDNKELDYGNGYTAHDGIYDVPVSGVYVFSWTVVADNHQSVNTELIVNGIKKGSMFSGSLSGIVPGTGVIVTDVTAGSHVFIRRTAGLGCTMLGQDSLAGTTFSGWLIFPVS